MRLPILLSVPHAGVKIPSEVEDICMLSEEDVIKDGDEGAAEIYLPLKSSVAAMVTTDIARAIVDMNRGEDDRRKDGIIKTHTCWDVPIYKEPPSEKTVQSLIEQYHHPYHRELTQLSAEVKLGIDCHTMAAKGPPVGPDPGVERPHICLSNAAGTCPAEWIASLAACLEKAFKTKVSINHPFKGGYIIRSHAKELPWIQLEFSRADFASNEEKNRQMYEALKNLNNKMS
ncbi:N-formylglutamate amidohydrolase [Thermodesulfobacteriota bacterium]